MWNSVVRKLMYTLLVAQFGPHSTWAKSTLPSNDPVENERYRKFCTDFSGAIGSSSIGGVQNQIAWATTKQLSSKNAGYVIAMFANKAMAYECGFIDTSYLPHTGLYEYNGIVEIDPDNAQASAE